MKAITTFFVNLLVLMAFVCIGCGQKATVLNDVQDTKKMEETYQLFNRLEAQGVETGKPLLYGYFFFDKQKSRLDLLAAELAKQSYSLVRLEAIDDGRFVLHVEKVEVHSAETLLTRAVELRALAAKFSVETYDGWDVGNVDPTKPLVSNESFAQFMRTKKGTDLFDLGIRLYDLEVNDRAAEVFTECLKQKINPAVSSFKLSVVLFELDKPGEAVFHLEQATKLDPNYFEAFFNLGAVNYESGNFQKSLDHYQTADRIKPNDEDTIYGIAANQFALGKFAQSRESCEKGLKINPNNKYFKELLAKLSGK